MKRIAIIILGTLVCLPAWAGTWRDDFARQELGISWQKNGNPKGKWKIENGVCVGEAVSIGPVEVSVSDLVAGNATWEDYTIEVKTKGVGKLNFSFQAWGIIARYQSLDEAGVVLTFILRPNDSRIWIVRRHNGGIWHILSSSPFLVKMDTWYLMKIIVKKADIETYVDDQLIYKFKDTQFQPEFQFPSGRVALFTLDMRVHFDDVKISGSDIPDGGSLAVQPKSKLAIAWGKIRAGKEK